MNKKTINRKPTGPKRKKPAKIKKISSVKPSGEAIVPVISFHKTFPVTLEYMDGKDFKRCFFVCKEHCDSYLKRYKLKKGSYKVFDTKPKNEEKE
jgi:hypothetical protein